MKRTNLVLDEKLLKEARKVTGERIYSAVVNKALHELVRVARLERGIQTLRDTPNVFWPNYLEEIRPNSYTALEKRKAAADAKRAASKAKSRARSAR